MHAFSPQDILAPPFVQVLCTLSHLTALYFGGRVEILPPAGHRSSKRIPWAILIRQTLPYSLYSREISGV